ncbi:MAG: uracil-DNA glycosylase [Deltaproteobacteria bacterium]|nr:uracil-DNA glycosylase [Deltaproteobacteria bacterium]
MPQDPPRHETRPNCYACLHYFVTWEPKSPHGCRALGFKSRLLPHVQVFRTSGASCHLFAPKRPRR